MTFAAEQPLAVQINRRILRAAWLISFATILVKVVAALKEVAVAAVYGRSDAMDAFLAAFLIPNLLINLISESMNQALIPTLVRVHENEGQRSAQQLLASAMAWMSLLLAGASALMALCTPAIFPLIASHFNPAKLALAEHIFYQLLPVVLLTGIASNCTSVLNTREQFGWPAFAPVVMPLAVATAALAWGARWGITALVWGTLAGALLHAVWMAALMQAHGYTFQLKWHGMSAALREVAGQYGTVLLSGVVASAGLLVDQAMAAMLPAGSVSALVYANRFVAVIMTLLAGTLASAITPYLSQLVAQGDGDACRHLLRTWMVRAALSSVPLTIGLIAGARWLIRTTYQHGAFTAADTVVVAPVLAMYAIQIPFFVCSRVPYRVLLALRRTDIILYCGIINLALDVMLNLVLMRVMGIAGIALATSLWTLSTLVFLWWQASRLLAREGDPA